MFPFTESKILSHMLLNICIEDFPSVWQLFSQEYILSRELYHSEEISLLVIVNVYYSDKICLVIGT